MRLAALFILGCMPVITASENVRNFPDVDIQTPAGIMHAVNLSVKKGGRTRLTGTLVNSTGKTWDSLFIRIQPSDGRGTVFNTSSLHLFSMDAGAAKLFYFDVTGKFDFTTNAYSIKYQLESGPRMSMPAARPLRWPLQGPDTWR